ncbi:MAG TPA: PQQ-binding-like beta-propeller repeat protein [Acidobacteriota bacterium]|nr:PQQ-binding-like beta-propeller repeat protein [Acidobacteriota bacterium]
MKSAIIFGMILAAGISVMLFWSFAAAVVPPEAYWPYWRGPSADGMAVGDAPLHWSDTQNVRWKTDIPGLGNSSPVVWGDRIFLTTAVKTGNPIGTAGSQDAGVNRRGGFGESGPQVEHGFEVLCVDRHTGKFLWQRTAIRATPHEGFHSTYGSFASNSPVTDGVKVYAFFGSRGMYCYDMNGRLLWQKDFGVQMRMKLSFGEGTAPVLSGDRLILVFDHEGDSFIVALDKGTGKELWRVSRNEKSNWSTPLVLEYKGRKQVVVSATRKVRSYDLETGRLIWECGGLGANTIPQPVYRDDLVFVMSGFRDPMLMAIRLGREGDLTGSDAVVWSQSKGNSYTPSPVIHDNKLYTLTDTGMISCYNARTGVPYYHQVRLPKSYSFKSSPVGANGKLYLASENEDVIVLRMGEKFEVLATNTMPDEMFIATPAIAGGEIFLRSQKRLYCVHED